MVRTVSRTPDEHRSGRPALFLVGLLVTLVVAVPAQAAFDHVTVVVDGAEMRVASGSVLSMLIDADMLFAHDGDIVSAMGGASVRPGEGEPREILLNGATCELDMRLREGDVIQSIDGPDVVESLVTTVVPVPPVVMLEGAGPLVSLGDPGVVGVRRIVSGAISGVEVTSTLVMPASPMVLRRYVPTPGDRVVALTFDDGPWPGQTEQILQILADHDTVANLFMVGRLADRYRELAHRVADEGHLVGNHSLSHTMLRRANKGTISSEMVNGQDVIARATGVKPTWFRPPGGGVNSLVWEQTRVCRLNLAMWDVDPQDWRKPEAEQLVIEVLDAVQPGSVILLHDGGGDRSSTIAALPAILDGLQAGGYTCVTLDDLAKQ
jgi:peptidoglycan/xylan/chitin deacetylase (PgdA/CDA1 family)